MRLEIGFIHLCINKCNRICLWFAAFEIDSNKTSDEDMIFAQIIVKKYHQQKWFEQRDMSNKKERFENKCMIRANCRH